MLLGLGLVDIRDSVLLNDDPSQPSPSCFINGVLGLIIFQSLSIGPFSFSENTTLILGGMGLGFRGLEINVSNITSFSNRGIFIDDNVEEKEKRGVADVALSDCEVRNVTV
jgi:hypothetical protein